MNTYYLKKFRKEAYERYGIMWFINTHEEEVWNVGNREFLKPSYACTASHYYNEKDAMKGLKSLRRQYILLRVGQTREEKNAALGRLKNKQLAKL